VMIEKAEATTGAAATTIATLMAIVADRDNEISPAAATIAACAGRLDCLAAEVDAQLDWQRAAVDEEASLREQLATAQVFRRVAESRCLAHSHDNEANDAIAVSSSPPAGVSAKSRQRSPRRRGRSPRRRFPRPVRRLTRSSPSPPAIQIRPRCSSAVPNCQRTSQPAAKRF